MPNDGTCGRDLKMILGPQTLKVDVQKSRPGSSDSTIPNDSPLPMSVTRLAKNWWLVTNEPVEFEK